MNTQYSKVFFNSFKSKRVNFINQYKFNFCSNLQKTAINDHHRTALKAKMVNFEGFDMPVQYPFGIIISMNCL